MGRIAGVPNKITKEVKEKIQDLVLKSIDSIDFDELSAIQKIKLIQIATVQEMLAKQIHILMKMNF